MRTYNEYAMYSFKTKIKLNPEIKMSRVFFRKNKKIIEIFYAERTTNPTKIAIPADLIFNLKPENRLCGGFTGQIKQGDYFMGKCKVVLCDAEQVYNNIGIVTVMDFK
jgi:hypothetical protein